RDGSIIGSAVTNLDIHDIARTARTYGIGTFYIVTPYQDQQNLVREIIGHWQTGHGSTYNPARKEAFELVELASSFEAMTELAAEKRRRKPTLVTTSANVQERTLSYESSKTRIEEGEATVLVFGTACGLAPELTLQAEYSLPPLGGVTQYNHLSVRAAVAITCDRLLG
ncbi:unnamed protein product, partial [Cyprideis torosa]